MEHLKIEILWVIKSFCIVYVKFWRSIKLMKMFVIPNSIEMY